MPPPSARRLVLALLGTLLWSASPGLGQPAGSGERLDALRERAEEVFHESVVREDMAAAAATFAAALDEVEAAGAEGGPEALVQRLIFLDHWVDEAGSTVAVGPVREVVLDRAAGYARELLGMLRSGDVPEEAWDELQRRTWFASRPQLLALWLGSEPRNPRLLAALADESSAKSLRLALFRAASAHLDSGGGEEAEALGLLFLQERVRALLGMGLAEEALQELEAAPDHRRGPILAASAPASAPVELDFPGKPILLEHRDLRLDLAAAYALRGEAARAADLLAALDRPASPPEPADQPRLILEEGLPGAATPGLQRRTLEWLLAASGALATPPPGDDPFDHYMDLLSVRDHSYGPTPLWRRVEAALAEATGYPDLAAYLLADSCRRLGSGYAHYALRRLTALGEIPDAVDAELEAIEESLKADRLETAAAIDRMGTSLPWVRRPVCAPQEAPVRPPERLSSILPPGAELEVLRVRGSLPETMAASTLTASDTDVVLPGERSPVALLRRPGELLALALQAKEGYNLGRDYLVFRSEDGGASWEGPHTTGIRALSPFEIVAGSPRNRRQGDELVLEAVLWRPSPALSGLEKGARVLLTLPVETLLADSDGDGLTDREELAILTDPREADTDGDGVGDGADRLTVLGGVGSADLDTERVLTLLVEEVLFPGGRSERRERCLTEELPTEARIPSWQTSFVAGREMPLAPLSRPERVVLLDQPPSDHDVPVLELHLFVFDRSRSRAFVQWSLGAGRSWEGRSGRHLLVRADDRPEGWRLSKGVRAGGCVTTFEDFDTSASPGSGPW